MTLVTIKITSSKGGGASIGKSSLTDNTPGPVEIGNERSGNIRHASIWALNIHFLIFLE